MVKDIPRNHNIEEIIVIRHRLRGHDCKYDIQTFSFSQSAGDGYRIRTKIERINIGT